MNDHQNPAPGRDEARAATSRRLGIEGLFLNVGELIRLTGLTGAGIRGQMREGRFPIAHRRMGGVILVKADDFLDWYMDAPEKPAMTLADFRETFMTPEARHVAPPPLDLPQLSFDRKRSMNVMPHAETSRERVARLKNIANQAVKSKRAV